MSESITLTIPGIKIAIVVAAERTAEHTWKLAASYPLVPKFTYAAVLRTKGKDKGALELIAIRESEDFGHWELMLPTYYDRRVLPERTKDFVAAGGYWQIEKGIFSVSVPSRYPQGIDELLIAWGLKFSSP